MGLNKYGHNSMTYQHYDSTLDIILLVIFLSVLTTFYIFCIRSPNRHLVPRDWKFFKLTSFVNYNHYKCYKYKMFYCSNLKDILQNITKYYKIFSIFTLWHIMTF